MLIRPNLNFRFLNSYYYYTYAYYARLNFEGLMPMRPNLGASWQEVGSGRWNLHANKGQPKFSHFYINNSKSIFLVLFFKSYKPIRSSSNLWIFNLYASGSLQKIVLWDFNKLKMNLFAEQVRRRRRSRRPSSPRSRTRSTCPTSRRSGRRTSARSRRKTRDGTPNSNPQISVWMKYFNKISYSQSLTLIDSQ